MVMRLPEGDRISLSREKLEADLAVAMGGRVAEELIFGHEKVTTGASSDIQMATSMARRMVTEWGLSDKLGPLKYSEDQQEVFLGHSVAQSKNMSDATAQLVDSEIRSIVDTAYDEAKQILTDKMDDLVKVSEALLEYETLSGEDIRRLLANEPLKRDDEEDDADASKPRATSVPTSSTRREPPAAGIGPDPEPQST